MTQRQLEQRRRDLAERSTYHLARCDIVLTTYKALRDDLGHDTSPDAGEGKGARGGGANDGRGAGGLSARSTANTRVRRRPQMYRVLPSPLTAIKWWRVCLDEAQMVETPTAQAAAMALRLDTCIRWCITGTPIQRGYEDLYGLLLFLRAAPFADRGIWTQAIERPLKFGGDHVGASALSSALSNALRLRGGAQERRGRGDRRGSESNGGMWSSGGGEGGSAALARRALNHDPDLGKAVSAACALSRLRWVLDPSSGGLLWRTRKSDVAHELQLPPQIQRVHLLRFSAIERYFYNKQVKKRMIHWWRKRHETKKEEAKKEGTTS